jgi:hypothetical protein
VAAAPSTVAASVGRGATSDSRSDGSAIGTSARASGPRSAASAGGERWSAGDQPRDEHRP